VAGALSRRAEAGVECNVLLDAFGSARMDPELIAGMQAAGVTVAWFRPPHRLSVNRANRRNHRKLLVADGTTAFTGGVGIADEWLGDAQDRDHWRETHVRIEGPAVTGLQGAFAESWREATGGRLIGDRHLPEIAPIPGGVPMQVVRSRAHETATAAETVFCLALEAARSTVRLSSAYFVPNELALDALRGAAARGVDVHVIVPGRHADKRVVREAGRAVYDELLEAGVAVHEYQPTMMHAKTMSVDGAWSLIGSINVDSRSLRLNEEVGVCVYDEATAGELDALFAADLERSRRIRAVVRRRRSAARGLTQGLAWSLRRQL
jgi:cardiolipin synthase